MRNQQFIINTVMDKELRNRTEVEVREDERFCREEAEAIGVRRMALFNFLGDSKNAIGLPENVKWMINRAENRLKAAQEALHEAEHYLKLVNLKEQKELSLDD